MRYWRMILPSVLVACILISGCNDSAIRCNDSAIRCNDSAIRCNNSAIIWSSESPSPNKDFVASASTEQLSGFGTAAVYTTVYLKQASQEPSTILELSYETAYPLGVTAVDMNWVTPSHLNITYKGNVDIDFQAIKCAGVEISIEKND